MKRPYVVATRRSSLALTQTAQVCGALESAWPELTINTLQLTTRGDQIVNVSLSKVGGKGLFTQEIEDALLAGQADFAVHSMKDMPTEFPAELLIGAVPPRLDPRDVLISRSGAPLMQLPHGARVGTSSLRRALCLKEARPDLEVVNLRGNIDTRIRKLDTEGLDAIVLAAAGLLRMGWISRITEYLSVDLMLPAAGQGALAIQCRADHQEMLDILKAIEDPVTRIAITAERTFLKRLNGGCQVPIGGHARIAADGRIRFLAMVGTPDGATVLHAQAEGVDPVAVGNEAANELLARGAAAILDLAREEAGRE
ncbi:MAG: hydroxymethylbilane synthase [Bacilli bacterium]|nr:hydroxymethylbilane synthase [Bacilli bacterium]